MEEREKGERENQKIGEWADLLISMLDQNRQFPDLVRNC